MKQWLRMIVSPMWQGCLLGLLPVGFSFCPPAQAATWDPPPPPKDDFDWIQLVSGEWLKGEFKGYIDDEIYFDSDKLDLQIIDLKDVKFLRTASAVRIGHQPDRSPDETSQWKGPRIAITEGAIELRQGSVYRQNGQKKIADVDELVSIAPGSESEWDNWSARVGVGSNFREGNNSQLDYSADARFIRSTPQSILQFRYLGNYGKSEGVEFANNHRATMSFDLLRSQNLFIRLASAEYYRDPFQNIQHRGMLASGLGYRLLETPKTNWKGSIGPAYLFTESVSVSSGNERSLTSMAGALQSNFDTELNDHVDFESSLQAIVTSSEAGLYSHQFMNGFSFELTDDLDFDISLIWEYTQNPRSRANGVRPKNNDFRLMMTLGLEL